MRRVRQVRLGFRGSERPSRVVITPAADYLFGNAACGYGYNHADSGPLTVDHRLPGDDPAKDYPVHLCTISQPWMLIDFDTYEAMST